MRAALETCRRWQTEGKQVAAATVVKVAGSTPRREGARLLVSSAGDTWGSVSNGCVEGDVAAHAAEVLRTGRPFLAAYGITDEFAFEVGLSCGGSLEVFIEDWRELPELLGGGPGEEFVGAFATVMDGAGQGAHGLFDCERGWTAGDLPAPLQQALAPEAAAAAEGERSQIVAAGEGRAFVEAVTPPPRLILFGAGHTAEALTPLAAAAGFRVTICDPRPALARPERYPAAAEVMLGWPDETVPRVAPDRWTYVVLLAHDPKIELPLLPLLLATPARYLGVLGSRKTQRDRVARLVGEGWPPEQLARLHGPVGLDIGAVTPEEVAVSIVAQMVAVRRGRPAGGRPPVG